MNHVIRWSSRVLALLLVVPTAAHAWVVTPELGYGHGVTTTAAGDIVSAGESVGTDLFDFSVRLQSALDGLDVWHYQLDGSGGDIPGSYNDYADDVVIDGAGDIIAAGQTRNTGTGLDLQIVKLSPAGAPIWTQTLDSAAHDNDQYSDLALHSGGDLAVAGSFGLTTGSPYSYFFSVARVAGGNGAVLWQHDVPGNPTSRAAKVFFDGAGNVLAAGDAATGTFPGSDMVAVKLDGATGNEIWRTSLSGGNAPVDDYAYVAAIDAAGDLYIGGQSSTETGDGFTVFKVSGATGAKIWQYDHTSTESYASALLLVHDGAGHVYAGGWLYPVYDLVKLDAATGVPVWNRILNKGYYTSLAFNPLGDLILSGMQGYNFALQKIRATDGKKRWRRLLKANGYNVGYASAVMVDATGAVLATGGSVSPLPKGPVNGYPSFTVVKACGANGRVKRTDACP